MSTSSRPHQHPSAHVRNVVPPGRPVSRRAFLELAGAAGIGAAVAPLLGLRAGAEPAPPGRGPAVAPPPGYVPGYPDGVMSGDPAPTSSVIWTRLAPPAAPATLTVAWQVATDATFSSIVAGGTADTDASRDDTVKVPVTGLLPDRDYSYRFSIAGLDSVTGRIRTSPAPDASPAGLRFVFGSCQQRSSAYVAHRAISEEPDVDFWMHLGDYVYVNDVSTLTLDDYRGVYHTFKSDPWLQQVQARMPTVAMFDDGEFYNGVDGAGPPARLAAALEAWFEQFPLIPPPGQPTLAHRSLVWGDLSELFVIDTRQHRDPAVDAIDTRTAEGAVIFDPARTSLGAAQRAWLEAGLQASSRRWTSIGSTYNFGLWRLQDLDEPWPRPAGVHPQAGVYAPNEAWDDYWYEREQLLALVRDAGVRNFNVYSAHTHIWLTSALKADIDDPTQPLLGYDFTAGSFTSDPDVIADAIGKGSTGPEAYTFYRNASEKSREVNPHQAYVNFQNYGYGLVTVEPERTVVEYKAVNVYDVEREAVVLARFTVPDGDPCAMTVEYFDEPFYNGPGPVTPVPHRPWAAPCPTATPPTSTPTTTSTTATTAPTGTGPTSIGTVTPAFTG
ncbi:MAG: alkaline phosphatase D family protein [Acidimicrobiales bacterium]